MTVTGSSRRTFIKSSTAVGAYLMGSRAFASSPRKSVIVVGAGAFGGWTALQLLEQGAKVGLLDAWGPGHSRGSSGGETRTLRRTYGSGRICTQMAARAPRSEEDYAQRWDGKLCYRGLM